MAPVHALEKVADQLRHINGDWCDDHERAQLYAKGWRLARQAFAAGAFHDRPTLTESVLQIAQVAGPRAALTALVKELSEQTGTRVQDVLTDGILLLAECVEGYSASASAPALGSSIQPTSAPPPSDDDDPRLWADATWVAFRDAYTALIDHPEYLEDKKPEAPEALNMDELNRLAREAGMTTDPVIELREDQDGNRYAIIHHPRVRRNVELRIYNRVPYWPGEPESKLKRWMDNLRAWCDLRREQLLVNNVGDVITAAETSRESSNLAPPKEPPMPRLGPTQGRATGPIKCGNGVLLVGNRTIAPESLAGSLLQVACARNLKGLVPVADLVQTRCESLRRTLLSLRGYFKTSLGVS